MLNENGSSDQTAVVLVVDDCTDMHSIIRQILAPIGVRIIHAFGGQECLRSAASDLPSLILLDYNMPFCDGMEVLQKLQSDVRLADIPVILITGDNDPTLVAAAYANGVSDYISKPFLPVELRARVGAVLKTQSLIKDLRHSAKIDMLTGLPNRTGLFERIHHAIDLSRHGLAAFAVMFIDLDRFKLVNDSLGHSSGDAVLIEAAQRLQRSVQRTELASRNESNAVVARFGGDEFVVLLECIASPEEAERIAERILSVMQAPYMVGGRSIYSNASIGVVTCSGQYNTPEELIRDADIAMYESKDGGRGCYRVFNSSMRNRAHNRLQMDSDLRRAIELNQFKLQYQPIVNLETGRVESVEALIRWHHPDRGIIPPLDFIPFAEETGLIVAIGEWVMRTACLQYADWQTIDPSAMPNHISINLSRQQLVQCDLPHAFQNILVESGIDPNCVHFEITESEIMDDLQASIQAINALRATGAKIDLDDFGTGYSSLACLHELPIDVLKLDRSLVSSLDKGGYFSKLVDLVLKLIAGTKIQAVAEGIETIEQLARLKILGCHLGQGYYFSKPIDADRIQEFVRKQQLQEESFACVSSNSFAPVVPTLFSVPNLHAL